MTLAYSSEVNCPWDSRSKSSRFCGLEIQPVMGSRSTYLKGKIGGLDGRALRAGDSIPFAAPVSSLPNMPWRFLGQNFGFPKTPHQVLRVIPGPQYDTFSENGIQTFLSSVYTVTGENDRMGYRFTGSKRRRYTGYHC